MKNKLRFIHLINKASGVERIAITEDLDVDVQDFIPGGMVFEVQSDTIVEVDLPSGFPINHEFLKD
jgi:hypothetical protein